MNATTVELEAEAGHLWSPGEIADLILVAAGRIPECPLWVKSGNSHREHMLSALPRKADIRADMPRSLLGAIFGLMHRSRLHGYSITSSAVLSSDGGTVMPSALAVLRLIVSWYFVGC